MKTGSFGRGALLAAVTAAFACPAFAQTSDPRWGDGGVSAFYT